MKRLCCAMAVLELCCAIAAGAQSAKDLLQAAGVKGGLVVHVGCNDGSLTAALRTNNRYLVHGLDTDAEQVARARDFIRSKGIYGPVSVDTFDGQRLPYVDNLVNLVVMRDAGCEIRDEEIMRVLAPDGVFMALRGGDWIRTVKPRPAKIDEWTHFLHGADNNAVAKDTCVISAQAQRHWQEDWLPSANASL